MQIFSQFSHPMKQDSADLVSGKQNMESYDQPR